jgi:hypothetical protein
MPAPSRADGGHGVVTGDPARVFLFNELPNPPSIAVSPENRGVVIGEDANFQVVASGVGPLRYQWWFGNTALNGATNQTLTLRNVQPADAGLYQVVVSNPFGSTGASASLSVYCGSVNLSTFYFGPQGGPSNVIVTAAAGQAWAAVSSATWITVAPGSQVREGDGEVVFSVAANPTAQVRNAVLTIAGRALTVIQATAETVKPTVTITVPQRDGIVQGAEMALQGNAADNAGLARVEYQLGEGAFQLATGTTNWTAQVSLSPGTNVIRVRSVDWSGNQSLPATRTIFYEVLRPLTLQVTAGGKVMGVTNGQMLAIGRAFTATATPDAGYVFAGWSGDVSSERPKLVFKMTAGLTLRANFIPNPFKVSKGAYNGLFFPTDPFVQVTPSNAGPFTLALTEQGMASGQLTIAGKAVPFSALRFSAQGHAQARLLRKVPLSDLSLDLQLGGGDTAGLLTGQVSDGVWQVPLLAYRAGVTSNQVGTYTFLVEGGPAEDQKAPSGYGAGTLVVKAQGTVGVAGTLGDGTKITLSSSVSPSGWIPLCASLQSGRGLFMGWVCLGTNEPLSQSPEPIFG